MALTASTPPAPPESVPTRTHRLTTANRATAAAELRAVVAALVRVAGHAPLVDSARLCTSELVTNVHRHTGAGLVHVEELTDAWGATYYGGPRPTSKAVWFRMVRGGRGAS
ncbi:hypothetical protein ACFYN0_15260 [Streptomyces sp. NPDC006704]|uniref:hypothetical protein n=1 Tax=Streptomyces sp. NPDC006704 TaxID=3364760 RepID=UPI0036895B35